MKPKAMTLVNSTIEGAPRTTLILYEDEGGLFVVIGQLDNGGFAQEVKIYLAEIDYIADLAKRMK